MENTLKALQLKSELDQLRPINKEQEARIFQKFRLDWNYHSNHLEGNSLTYGETKALILHGITAQGKTLKDHFEITGHNEAINWVIDMVSGERPLTQNFIRELHTLLLKESYEVDAQTVDGKPTKKRVTVGSYKTTPNHVLTKTGEMFYFATPEETPAEMNDLLVWYDAKSKETDVNPILLAAQFHYKFIRIHPFDDGNGRTARILMNFILMKFGFPPCIIKSDKDTKDEYFSVLQLADVGNIEAFIEYIAENVNRSLEIMIAGAKGEDIEEDDDLDKEIALLEQKLNSFEYKNTPKKHSIDINFIEYFVFSIVELFFKTNLKFSKLYEENNFSIQIGNEINYLNDESYFAFLKQNFSTIFENKEFLFEYSFKNLKKLKLNQSYFFSKIEAKFLPNNLRIKVNDRDYTDIEYEKVITDKEIQKIIKREINRHKFFIQQKISETEKSDK